MTSEALTARYETVAKQAVFEGEEVPGNRIWPGSCVHYLTDEERAAHRLDVINGVVRDAQGRRFDTADGATHWSGQGWAIFVMDAAGAFYASKRHLVGRFHHSSLGQGRPVAGAGELQVRDGLLVAVTDHSSHYCPPRRYTEQVLRELNTRGVAIEHVAMAFRY